MIPEQILKQIKPGAQVAVQDKIGTFKGVVLARKHGKEAGATFTVRATLQEVGVEKIYPINSPSIIKVKIINSPQKIHKSKLYFLRGFSKKRTRKKIGVAI